MKYTGGPAFPTKRRIQRAGYLTDEYEPRGGMTLRDYFAAKAMQTLLGSEYTSNHGLHEGWMRALAQEAYTIADAMLKERSNGKA